MAVKNYSDKNISQISKPQLIVGSKILPTNDAFYGPYTSREDAHLSIVKYLELKGTDASAIPQGLRVGVIDGDKIKEYWYERTKESDELYTVEDLVEKQSSKMSFKPYSSTEYPNYE